MALVAVEHEAFALVSLATDAARVLAWNEDRPPVSASRTVGAFYLARRPELTSHAFNQSERPLATLTRAL
eukprot:2071224-Pleurochrysis_carterae.AAC.1